eukprot:GHVU01034882.1.p1 GENE.GHVU01034882.1~~GHVU01034882.1.p1  ORF type:complete len:102 (-),score=11.24 GHVU01034882.1:107-412(-)
MNPRFAEFNSLRESRAAAASAKAASSADEGQDICSKIAGLLQAAICVAAVRGSCFIRFQHTSSRSKGGDVGPGRVGRTEGRWKAVGSSQAPGGAQGASSGS